MSLRNKKRNNQLDSMDNHFQPLIGLFNQRATLNCQVQPQLHHFNINLQHPLNIITKLTNNCKKYAFQKLIQSTFSVKIQQKTTFVPQALLNGNYQVIHQYKKMLQRSRIGSYIKLNIRRQQKSYQKKKPLSLDLNKKHSIHQTQKSNIYSKVFNQNTVNEKTTKKIHQYLGIKQVKNNLNSTYNNIQTSLKRDRSFMTSKTSNKINQQNININFKIQQNKEIRNINHTHVHHIKKSKSNTKSKQIDGIKINYIEIKGAQQNPQMSTFIYKSTATKTHKEPSQFGTKTQFFSPNFQQFDNTLNNDLSFSIHHDKISMHTAKVRQHENDDNLSQKYQKSIKNSQMSQLTHDQMYTKDYFFNDRKILKKGRKAVYIESFDKNQIV